MSELPPGWALATIDDLIADNGIFVDGDWVETKDQDPTGDVRLTQLADVGDGFWRNRSDRRMTSSAADRLGCTPLMVDDVLVARMPEPLGRACLFPGDQRTCVTVVDVAIVRPGSDSVSPRWLMWAINAPEVRSAIGAQQAGTTRKRISRTNLGAIPLPTAPRAEQERIVVAIEEAFSKLGAGEGGLRTVRQLLKRIRDAILDAAVAGRLVAQDPADTPATDLADFDTEPIDPITSRALPDGWACVRVGDCLGRIEAGKSFATLGRPAVDGEVGVIKVSAMTWGEFRPEENKAIPLDSKIDERWTIRGGDLLFSRANTSEYVGACVLVPQDHPGLILSDKSLRLVPIAGVSAEWLLLALRSRPAREQIERHATGTKESMRNVSQAKLRSIEIAVPPPEEQVRIVSEVDRQVSFIAACERAVDAGLAQSAALHRSVLKSAFEGHLVPQDPTDEPASVMLERIRDQRDAAPKANSRRSGVKA
ncbi:MAG: restriction endonuclease subunit S [Acidimicrobiales bacterium]